MNAKLTFDTQLDLLRGIAWFDKISLGLGGQFESEFYNALERIKDNKRRTCIACCPNASLKCLHGRSIGVVVGSNVRSWAVLQQLGSLVEAFTMHFRPGSRVPSSQSFSGEIA